jgi:hypothetical protein
MPGDAILATDATRLVAFAQAIDEIVLDGCGGESMRVVRVERDGSSPSLVRDGVVDGDAVTAVIDPVLRSKLEVFHAEGRPDWQWRLELAPPARVASYVTTAVGRLASSVRGVADAQHAFAREAEAALRRIVDGAHTFELVSNHELTCCGAAIYVIEAPAEWILVELYAFC